MTEYKPASERELADALLACARAKQTIRLGGHFTKDDIAGRVEADVTVTTCAMRRVLQYDPRDLTVSVEAGLPWAEFSALLAAKRQTVPLDPPWFEHSTVGGVVAANLSGPRRKLYGTARDVVIGMRFATLEGNLVQAGGMVVKNVAGLDMAKLMIGSWGTLAAMAVVNFKVAPLPPETASFALRSATLDEAIAVRDRILQSALQPAALDLLNPAASVLFGLGDGYTLLLQAGGTAAVLDRYRRELGSASELDSSVWDHVREFVPRTGARRLDTTLTGIREVLAAHQTAALARAGTGVVYVAGLPAGDSEPSAMMKKVKDLFDPDRLLNRGRSYDGF